MAYLWWLVKPLFWWVRSKSTRDNPEAYLELDRKKPVLYVLPKNSIVDLLVLYYHCLQNNLPLPNMTPFAQLLTLRGASFLCMSKPGLLSTRSSFDSLHPMLQLVTTLARPQYGETDVQVVPVSIFWGKNPGTEDVSLIRLIFNDDENAGALHKFFIVLAQGRNNLINFGKPISVRSLLGDRTNPEDAGRKLRRILRIHFRIERNTTLGQRLYIRDNVIAQIVRSPAVTEAIQEESKKKRSSEQKAQELAVRYAREIAADQSYPIVRMFEVLLGKLWNKMYSGVKIRGLERPRECANKGAEVIYAPAHRSHLDYLLINYSVYASGLPVPHTASGINLNFWPAGPIIRRSGAFFLRRSFRGNRLYSAVFNEYLHYLITKGFPIAFFPEGGRSRSGRLLGLKTGLLSMLVQSYLRDQTRPLVFMPVYIGYDKVVEVRTYLKELSGKDKKPESIKQLFELRRILKKYWGHAYISFGDPIDLGEFLDKFKSDWREQAPEKKTAWFHQAIRELANEIAVHINEAVTVSPTGLMAVALLSAPNRALPEEELLGYLAKLIELGKHSPFGHQAFMDMPVTDYIVAAEKLESVKRFKHPAGDLIFFSEDDGVINSYYKNNILHIFALPSLISAYFVHVESLRTEDILLGCMDLYPFLKEEFQLPWSLDKASEIYQTTINGMIEAGFLRVMGEGMLARPEQGTDEFGYWRHVARILRHVLERYAMIAALLSKNLKRGEVDSAEFETQCQKMAQRLAILSGVSNPETMDKSSFSGPISLIKRMGYIVESDKNSYKIDPRIAQIHVNTRLLLSLETRFAIERLAEPSAD